MTVTFERGMHSLATPVFIKPAVADRDWSRGTPVEIEQAAADLVDAIARAGWEIPDVDVTISTLQEKDGRHFRRVTQVCGETEEGQFDFKFYGGTASGLYGSSVRTGVSSCLVPPGLFVEYFSDGSGPIGQVYNTDDWKADGARLRAVSGVNAALGGKERASIQYRGRQGSKMMPTGDNRDYQPRGSEKPYLDLDDVRAEVVAFIGRLTDRVLSLPAAPFQGVESLSGIGDPNLVRLATVEKVPVPRDFPVLHTFVESREISEILEMYDNTPFRVISPDSNWRLLSMRYGTGDDRVNEGYQFCTAGGWSRDLHPTYSVDERGLPVEIKLKWLNDVYIVDRSLQERARERIVAKMKSEGRAEATDAEVRDLSTAVARSFVPVDEYLGNYQAPVYLVGRQLMADEARLIQGPVTLEENAEQSRIYVTDRETGNQVDLHVTTRPLRWRHPDCRRLAEDFAFYLDDMSRQFDVISDVPAPEPLPDITEFLAPKV